MLLLRTAGGGYECALLCCCATQVTMSDGTGLTRMNEIECVDGEVLANIWFNTRIARIDPNTGHVLELIDFSKLNGYAAVLTPAELHDCRGGGVTA